MGRAVAPDTLLVSFSEAARLLSVEPATHSAQPRPLTTVQVRMVDNRTTNFEPIGRDGGIHRQGSD